MNKHQLLGAIQVRLGVLEERCGQITGNTQWRLSGVKRQVLGQTQRVLGNARHAIKGATLKR